MFSIALSLNEEQDYAEDQSQNVCFNKGFLPVEAVCCSAKGSFWNGSPRLEREECSALWKTWPWHIKVGEQRRPLVEDFYG